MKQEGLTSDRFGVTGGGTLKKWMKYGEDGFRLIEEDTRLMRDAGVRWVRVGLSVESSLPERERFIGLLQKQGINVLGNLSLRSRPEDRGGFRKAVTALVRSHPDITVWEMGNEPNLSEYWKSPREEYVPALQDCYEAAKEGNPKIQVACAGISEWKAEPFIELMVRQESWKFMDYFAFHPYASQPEKVVARLESVRQVMKGSPLFDKPIWITEIGFHTAADWKNNAGHVRDEAAKAASLEETFNLLAKRTQGPIFWYTFQEDFAGKTLGYGLLNREVTVVDGKIKDSKILFSDAYERYRQMAQRVKAKA